MDNEITITWIGKSGNKYRYWIYPIGKTFDEEPGNYVFAKKTIQNKYSPIYIGETGDLSERFDDHHKMPCIKKNGATHITVHASSTSVTLRRNEEKDLINNYDPICNG